MKNDEIRMTNDEGDGVIHSSFRHSSFVTSPAFTLLEMIVVVAIIGILFALVVPYAWKSI